MRPMDEENLNVTGVSDGRRTIGAEWSRRLYWLVSCAVVVGPIVLSVRVHAETGRLEGSNCASPGSPELWEASYCLKLAGTDDVHAEAVEECLGRLYPEWKGLAEVTLCAQSIHWHE